MMYPDRLCPLRDFDSHQLFNCQDIAQVVAHGCQIVEPVGQRQDLVIGAVLGELLDTTVQIADMRGYLR